jgi:Respiratory-chain NADH dehydrogenase 51 Kd subunit
VAPDVVIEELAASGLRGRGSAGFPTGVKWRTIKSYASPSLRTSVVINAAEGEPGTFKDRTIIRANPYWTYEVPTAARHRSIASPTIVPRTLTSTPRPNDPVAGSTSSCFELDGGVMAVTDAGNVFRVVPSSRVAPLVRARRQPSLRLRVPQLLLASPQLLPGASPKSDGANDPHACRNGFARSAAGFRRCTPGYDRLQPAVP